MLTARETPQRAGSWVVVDKATGLAVLETFSPRVANAINRARYDVVPILAWLQGINTPENRARAGAGI